jgi:hypothetical protein
MPDEASEEEWAGTQEMGLELRMELGREKERMFRLGKLRDLHEKSVRRYRGENESGLLERLDIFRIHFIAVAMRDELIEIEKRAEKEVKKEKGERKKEK